MGWHPGAQRTGTQRSVDSDQRTSPGGGSWADTGAHTPTPSVAQGVCRQPRRPTDAGAGTSFLQGVAAPGKPAGSTADWPARSASTPGLTPAHTAAHRPTGASPRPQAGTPESQCLGGAGAAPDPRTPECKGE